MLKLANARNLREIKTKKGRYEMYITKEKVLWFLLGIAAPMLMFGISVWLLFLFEFTKFFYFDPIILWFNLLQSPVAIIYTIIMYKKEWYAMTISLFVGFIVLPLSMHIFHAGFFTLYMTGIFYCIPSALITGVVVAVPAITRRIRQQR